MTEQEFEELKKSVQQGDNSTLGVVVRAFAPNCIRQLQVKFGCSLTEAKDIFSEAFIKLHGLLVADKIAHGNLGAYIFAICRSLYLDKHSKKRNLTKRKEVLMDDTEEVLEQYSLKEGDTQNELAFNPLIKAEHEHNLQLQQKKDLARLLKAFEQLHPRCRRVLSLAIMHKLKYAQIVEIMGFANTQTVKSTKYNCLKKLRAILKNTNK